jgi:alkylhydroperoxidase/carboxymuconolactone decarboxylase family protein YurZ
MSKVGDVVFCVDCDLARSTQLKVASGDSSGAPTELRRRMATKKDASGDMLCTACLDARVQRRRAEFLKPAARNVQPEPQLAVPSVGRPTVAALRGGASRKPLDKPARRFSSVRIERVRSVVKSTARKPLDHKRVVSEILAEAHRATERASKAKALEARTKSLQLLAAEIGLSRAHELLAQIRAAALAVVGRTPR